MHICLINLPRHELHRPPLSLAILGEICESESVSYECIDFSLIIFQKLHSDFFAIDDFCITRNIDNAVLVRLKSLIDQVICDVVTRHPDATFAMSLLSSWSQPVCELMCASIRQHSNCKILIGGQGLTPQSWTESMKSQNQIDDYIVGEGEISFRNFLKGERTGPGINNYDFEQINDLNQHVVIPNYNKLPLDQYPALNNKLDLFITASRGCVRNCAYCDVGHQWKKYRYRSAANVAQEMITQYERHGITEFFFTDSLINGSMKMLNELCDELIAYKKHNPEADFKWRGQYIFRPKTTVDELHIQKMAEAGVVYLIVGLETGSDRVRYRMNKKHTTDDAEWFLEMFKKYGISCHLLMLTGWVTETLEDHQETLSLFSKWQKYVASGTVTGIELGSTLTVLEHSPLGESADEYGMHFINDKPYLWEATSNPDLTVAERFRRRVELHREAIKYIWPITRSLYRLTTIKNHLLELIEVRKSRPKPKSKKIIPISLE